MAISTKTINQITNSFFEAEARRQPVEPVRSIYPEITVEEGYQVQTAVIKRFLQQDFQVIGKKAAATSAAAQAKMNIHEPIYGHLFDFHQAAPGQTLPAQHFIQPFIECELAFIMNRPLEGPGLDEADVLAVTGVAAAFDIIDFRAEWQTGMPEALCYNVYTRHIVLGQQAIAPSELDLPNLNISLSKNGQPAMTATGAAIMGHPARSIAWIANKLAEHGRRFQAGEIALTGAITRPQAIVPGDHFEASFEGLGTLTIGFS